MGVWPVNRCDMNLKYGQLEVLTHSERKCEGNGHIMRQKFVEGKRRFGSDNKKDQVMRSLQNLIRKKEQLWLGGVNLIFN